MLKRIVVVVLAVVAVLSVGCRESGHSAEDMKTESAWNLVYEAPTDVYYSALCFPDEDNGWVIGFSGRILHTSDGGTTWEAQDSGTSSDLQCIQFANDRLGWIGTRDGRIGRTTDGGNSWTWQEPLETNPQRVFTAICFVDDETGWIVDNTGNILHTEDGGGTWLPQDSGVNWCISSVQFLDYEEGWATGMSQILRTSDGGETWTASKVDVSFPCPTMFRDMHFVDGENGWISTDITISSSSVDTGTPLLHTADGGNTWQVQASFPHEAYLSRVRFTDYDTGWIVGSDDIFYTQDSGDSWSLQSITGGLFMDISFADPLHPWVLSFEGKVYRYGNASDSLKEEDGVAQDRVFVEFTVPSGDSQVSDLLDSLGSHIIETGFYNNRVQVSVPQGMSVTDTVDALEKSELVEDAEPYYLYAPDEVTVKFNVAHDDERVTDLLESLGSQITRTYEYSDFVLVGVPEDKTVAEMVDALSRSPLVEYAEPNYCYYITAPDYTCF